MHPGGSDGKRNAATAGGRGVGIGKAEEGTDQIVHKIDLGAVDQCQGHFVDNNLDPVRLEHQIIAAHGGELRCESEVGEGTSMILEFPPLDA